MEPLCHGWPLAPTSIDHHSIMDVSLHQDASHCDMSACVGPVDDHITDPLRYLGTVVLPFHGNRTSKIVLVLKSQTPSPSTTCRPPCSHTECGGDISGRGIFLLIPPPPPPPPELQRPALGLCYRPTPCVHVMDARYVSLSVAKRVECPSYAGHYNNYTSWTLDWTVLNFALQLPTGQWESLDCGLWTGLYGRPQIIMLQLHWLTSVCMSNKLLLTFDFKMSNKNLGSDKPEPVRQVFAFGYVSVRTKASSSQ